MKALIEDTIRLGVCETMEEAVCSFAVKLRKFQNKEKQLVQGLKSLYRVYGNSADEKEKRIAILLSAFVYDMFGPKGTKHAIHCCELLNEPSFMGKGYSLSEKIYLKYMVNEKQIAFPLSLSSYMEDVPTQYFAKNESDAIILKLSDSDIFCYRDDKGALVLLNIIDYHDGIICDEEGLDEEPPLYFTHNSHFCSPVFKLEQMSMVINEILLKIGYPYLRIKYKVLYTSNNVTLINEEDMWESESQWKGKDLENVLLRKQPYGARPFHALGKRYFPNNLIEALKAGGLLYSQLVKNKVYTVSQIRKMVQSADLFK